MAASKHSLSPNIANKQYTLKLLPEADKRRAHKREYCRRLARNLAHFDKYPWLWGVGDPPPQAPMIQLPPELRQKILSEVLEDEELSFSVESHYKKLRIVCKTFVEDLKQVSKEWDRRLAKQAAGHALSRASINKFIEDLNTARESQAEALRLRKLALKAKDGQKGKKKSRRNSKNRVLQKQLRNMSKEGERKKIKFNNKGLKYKGNRIKFD